MLIQGAMRRLFIPFVMAWTCAGVVLSGMKRVVGARYMRCRARVFSRAQSLVASARWFLNVVSGRAEMSSSPNRHARNTTRGVEDDSTQDDRAWGDMRGRRRRQLAQRRSDRVDYFVYAQMYEMNASHTPHDQPPSTSIPPPSASSAQASTAGGVPGTGPLHGVRPGSAQLPRQRPNFTAEEQHYLHSRLPIRQPASTETAINHFRRLPFLYSDLAEGYRLRLADLPRGTREWQRRQKMAALAQGLADRYHRFRLVLPRSYIESIISRSQSEPRASKFWEKVLDEAEKANQAWVVVPFWVLLFVIQSSLVAVAFQLLPAPAQVALLLANGLAYLWSTTVMCEMLHTRYTAVKADEQELHDLMGGLTRPI